MKYVCNNFIDFDYVYNINNSIYIAKKVFTKRFLEQYKHMTSKGNLFCPFSIIQELCFYLPTIIFGEPFLPVEILKSKQYFPVMENEECTFYMYGCLKKLHLYRAICYVFNKNKLIFCTRFVTLSRSFVIKFGGKLWR